MTGTGSETSGPGGALPAGKESSQSILCGVHGPEGQEEVGDTRDLVQTHMAPGPRDQANPAIAGGGEGAGGPAPARRPGSVFRGGRRKGA